MNIGYHGHNIKEANPYVIFLSLLTRHTESAVPFGTALSVVSEKIDGKRDRQMYRNVWNIPLIPNKKF